MKEQLKRLIRFAFIACFWVFLFSIRWEGKTLFSYLHSTLVENKIVGAVDETLGEFWFRITETARITFKKISDDGNTKKDTGA